ncbi:MAG: hypothetical protein EU551_03100 [Promethearchaeota archaeon]|nr:MAG: hypothetical protein EU551_03100 [Candidatus Lokiarchaeota archaeon]
MASKGNKMEDNVETKSVKNVKIFSWEMDKFRVMLSDSENIMVALMLENEPSEAIKEALIKFTYQFEKKYDKPVKNFRGNLEVFKSARPLAEDIFNLFLMQPQMLPLDLKELNKMNLNIPEKKLIRTAQKIQEDRGFFFFTHLISEHAKKTNIDQKQMFKMIFDIHQKGGFISIPPEKVSREIERKKIYQILSEIPGMAENDINILLKDLLASSPESREFLLNKIKEFKKKTMSEEIQNEILERNTLRKKRSDLFEQIDGYLQQKDYESVVNLFNNIINISRELGDFQMAEELVQRSQKYQQTVEQMTNIIPQLRSARNEALNKAELYELGGKYIEAAEFYKKAADYSVELGELEVAKEYEGHIERMKSLEELAKLRRSLGS